MPDRSCTVPPVLRSICRLLPGLLLASALAGGPALAREDDGREPREYRDLDREAERELDRQRDLDRDRARELERDRDDERSGRDGGEDRDGDDRDEDHDDDRDEDRRGESRNERRRARIDVQRDERGGDRQRDEVLLIGPDGVADAVRGAGYQVLSEQRLEAMRRSLVRVRVRDRETVEQAVDRLRQRVPDVRAAPNHVFTPQGAPATAAAGPVAASQGDVRLRAGRIGVIDTGADASLAPVGAVIEKTRGFAPGGYTPRAHGSAVAQLAGSRGAAVILADVFGLDSRRRLVAPADAIAAAVDWLLAENLRVLNISIEGPRNDVLEYVIGEAVARGTAIVAAVGNGGPSAPPGYPAAFPGVIAVTAVDQKGVVYRRASRGTHVQFAARGDFSGTGPPVVSSKPVSGTSFAAPLVAAALEQRWRQRPQATREQLVAALRAEARDLGKPGWDPVYGWGSIDPR